MPTPASAPRRTLLSRFLGLVERGGNALPHPATLFALMALLVVVISGIAAQFDLTVTHPSTQRAIQPVSLLSVPGLHRMMTEMVSNFAGFAPLGTVLVAMLGIAVAEGSGLIGAGLKLVVLSAPPRLLTAATVFAGVMSNTGGEVGYVLLIPLAAIMFHAVGRNPLAGLATAFAGVSGGYSANLLLGTVDPLLAGLSSEAARIVIPGYEVNPSSNYYFMAASTFLIVALGTFVTERIVEPRLGPYTGEAHTDTSVTTLGDQEKRGLWWAAGAALLLTALALWGLVPANGFLRDLTTGGVLRSPFISGIVAVIFIAGVVTGLAYGVGARTI
ncbi:MAG TPA: AbgT family transporter, partial [Vicinamibacterales bacterium]|nr:AbgT family transporter [Vicinamibacterales bacterium]